MAEVSPQNGLLALASSLLTGGGIKYLVDWRREQSAKKAGAPQQKLDENMLTLTRTRDELEDDNSRLRQTLHEERVQHAADRAEWTSERTGLRAEIDALQDRLRLLLQELADLRERHHI